MNQNPAGVSIKKFANITTIRFDKIPNQTELFLDFQNDAETTDEFYPEKYADSAEFAKKVLENYKTNRVELCGILAETNQIHEAGKATFDNIELLKQKDCVAVLTGQQAGLFSGELYSIYKALTAVKFSEQLKKQKIKAVPVFWIAEEDHDFDEVKKFSVINKNGSVEQFSNEPENYRENNPVGFINFDETVQKIIDDLFAKMPRTEFSETIKEILENSYNKNENYGSAFAKFIGKLFEPYGLILVSPLNENLKKLCAPIFFQAVEKSEEIVGKLIERSENLKKKGYHSQVLVEKNSHLFFYQNPNGERQSLRFDAEKNIKIRESAEKFSKAELLETAEKNPQRLSPNALLRPVVQDYLFPTIAYFGGAAEIAYFAQNEVIYETLNRPKTPIRHRASLTIIPGKHRRTMNKYAIEFTELFAGKDKILSRIVEEYLNKATAETFAEVEENINKQLSILDKDLVRSEPTLSINLANKREKILWHLNALRKKYHKAETLKNKVIERRIRRLFEEILPRENLQERALNVINFLNLYNLNFIDWIYQTIDFDEKGHQIVKF